MEQAKISSEEWLTVWDDTTQLEAKYKELKQENKILEDWCKRLEYRILQLEEAQEEEDTDVEFEDKEDI